MPGDLRSQFAAIHSGHDDIGEQKIDGASVAIDDLQRGRAVFGFEDSVPLLFQVLLGEATEIRLRLRPAGWSLGRDRRVEDQSFSAQVAVLFANIDARKIGAERGAALRLAVDENIIRRSVSRCRRPWTVRGLCPWRLSS